MNKKILIRVGILFLTVVIAIRFGTANAASTLFGEASIVAGGNPGMAVQAVSDSDPGFGGVSFDDANGTFISGLTTLSTDFNVTDDNCGGGSPRFSIKVDMDDNGLGGADKNIFVYLGPHPNFTGCTQNTWTSSGNLVTTAETRWDTSQLSGGTFYDTYANASALAGSHVILRISLVVDSSWSADATGGDGEQTNMFDNVIINNASYDFEPPSPTPTLSPTPNPFAVPAECQNVPNLNTTPIVGTNGADNINGTPGNDLIFALGGADRVDGKNGSDCIVGGAGADSLTGNNGNDVILGGAGADYINGNNGSDSLYGEDGPDLLRGGNGPDALIGGAGQDQARGEGGTDTCTAESEISCEL